MYEDLNQELKKELVKEAIKNLEDPWKMLTVKDVAKDLYMGVSSCWNATLNATGQILTDLDKVREC